MLKAEAGGRVGGRFVVDQDVKAAEGVDDLLHRARAFLGPPLVPHHHQASGQMLHDGVNALLAAPHYCHPQFRLRTVKPASAER